MGSILKYFIPLIAIIISGADPAPIQPVQNEIKSQSVPPLAEESWVFADGPNQYFVGKSSGKVTVIRGNAPAPNPNVDPVPPPNPPPIVTKQTKWVSLVLDPTDVQAAGYRTDPQARLYFKRLSIDFRTYLATEQDIAALGFEQLVNQIGLPMVITQDQEGAPIVTRRITDPADWQAFYEGLK